MFCARQNHFKPSNIYNGRKLLWRGSFCVHMNLPQILCVWEIGTIMACDLFSLIIEMSFKVYELETISMRLHFVIALLNVVHY